MKGRYLLKKVRVGVFECKEKSENKVRWGRKMSGFRERKSKNNSDRGN